MNTTKADLAALQAHLEAHIDWGPGAGVERARFMALALCGEIGELSELALFTLILNTHSGKLANLMKKGWRGDKEDYSLDITEELADIGNYLFMLAATLGIDLQRAMLAKMEAVEKRPAWINRVVPA